jgi:hypothetical protein
MALTNNGAAGFLLFLKSLQLHLLLPAGLASTELPLPGSPPAGHFLCAGGKLAGMGRRPDKLDLITGFTVVVIVTIAEVVAQHFFGNEHPLLHVVGTGALFFVLAMCAHWLVRQG